MQTLNGYTFNEANWKTLGGTGQCVMATKDNKKYFIKRLNRPKYPVSSYQGEFRAQKITECDNWLKNRKAIIAAIPGEGTGNIVKPVEYFRDGAIFYEVAHFVEIDQIPYSEIYKESERDKACVMMTAASSLKDLHSVGIVHGDLDPNNILISRSPKGMLVTKIIDMTDAFFEKSPPKSIVSKDAWWSPEVALYSKAHDRTPNPYLKFISCKADVFSLGLIFHQYCTKGGEFPKHKGNYPYQGFAGGGNLEIDSSIEPNFRYLIGQMIQAEPNARPTMAEVHRICQEIWRGTFALPDGMDKTMGTPPFSPPLTPPVKEQAAPPPKSISSDYIPGLNKVSGASVVDVTVLNEKKVQVSMSNGKTQIYDTKLALAMGYIKRNNP